MCLMSHFYLMRSHMYSVKVCDIATLEGGYISVAKPHYNSFTIGERYNIVLIMATPTNSILASYMPILLGQS